MDSIMEIDEERPSAYQRWINQGAPEGIIDIARARRYERAGEPVPSLTPEEEAYRQAKIGRAISAIALPLIAITEAVVKSKYKPQSGQATMPMASAKMYQQLQQQGSGIEELGKLVAAAKAEKGYRSATQQLPPSLTEYSPVLSELPYEVGAPTLSRLLIQAAQPRWYPRTEEEARDWEQYRSDLKQPAGPKPYMPKTPEQWTDIERELQLKSQYRPEPAGPRPYTPMTPEQWADYAHKLQLQSQYAGTKQESQQEARREQEVTAAARDFSKTAYLFRNTWDRKKEQLGSMGAGPIIGRAKEMGAALQVPGQEATAAYDGQVTETALALSRIVTGQSRLVESVFERIARSLPNARDTEPYAKRKLEQSVRNAYGLLKSMREYGTVDRLQNATDEEIKDRNSDVNREISSLAPSPLDENDERQIQEILKVVFGGGERKPGSAPAQGSTRDNPAKIDTRAAYDAMTPGQWGVDSKGNVFQKK